MHGFKEISKFRSHFTSLQISFIIAKIGTIYRIYLGPLGGVSLYYCELFFVIMAGYLSGYDYEPAHTTEELIELSRAAITTSVLHLKTYI